MVAACGGGGGTDPDAAGPPPDAYVDHAGPLFEPDHIVQVSIQLDAGDWATLRAQTRTFGSVLEGDCLGGPPPSPFETYPGSITVDGTAFPMVGIKKKGFFGSLDPVKPSLKIKFDEYVKHTEYLGLEKLTLNNSHQDPSYIRQCLAYQVFAKAGIPASRCNFARVTVNGEDLGVYVNVESIDHKLTKRSYADGSGNLYEGSLSDFRTDWVNTFDPKGDGDRSDLMPLATAMETASDAQLVDAVSATLDLDEFYTYWATEMITAHWDGYSNDKNNYFVYHDPTTDRLQLIPWGVDATFQPGVTFGGLGLTNGPIGVAASGIVANRLFALASTRATFIARQRQLLTTVWSESELLAEVDRMETLIAPIADTHGTSWHAAVTGVRDFITNRRSVLTAALDAGPTWDKPLDTYPCLDVVAVGDATFATTYGTLGAANPLTTGSGTIALGATTMSPVGATSGLDPNPAAGTLPTALVQIFGVRASDNHIIVVSLSTPPSRFYPRLADVGFFDAFGAVYDFDPVANTATLLGFMLGTLDLTHAGTGAGAQVSGTLHGNVDAQGTAPAKLSVHGLDDVRRVAARTSAELANRMRW